MTISYINSIDSILTKMFPSQEYGQLRAICGQYSHIGDSEIAEAFYQALPGSITRVDSDFDVKIRSDWNYDPIYVGCPPRAELQFNGASDILHIGNGEVYRIKTELTLPQEFEIDASRQVGFIQLHQQEGSGSPPFMLALNVNQIQVRLDNGVSPTYADIMQVNPGQTILVDIIIKHTNNATGFVQIFINGELQYEIYDIQTAYPSGIGYFKAGLYKWNAFTSPSILNEVTAGFRNFKIERLFKY